MVSPREEKSKVAGSFRPGGDVIVQSSGDDQFGDSRQRTRCLFPGNSFQNPALGNGNHHDPGSNLFAWRIVAGKFECMTKEQFFEPGRFRFPAERKSHSAGAETADRPRCYFERPYAVLIDSKLGVT